MRKIFTERKPGFSLMEMMIVLLIVAIVAAATAPLITKKMARNSGAGGGPIGWHSMTDYGNAGKGSLIIGAKKALINSKIYINSNGNNQPQLGFGSNGTLTGILGIQPNGRISFGGIKDNMAVASADHATAIGSHAQAKSEGTIAFGNQATANCKGAIAVGNVSSSTLNVYDFTNFNAEVRNASGSLQSSVSLTELQSYSANNINLISTNNINLNIIKGIEAPSDDAAKEQAASIILEAFKKTGDSRLTRYNSINMTKWSKTSGNNRTSDANGIDAVAIGSGAYAKGTNAVAIGACATANGNNAISIGVGNSKVNIPGQIKSIRADAASIKSASIEHLATQALVADSMVATNNDTFLKYNTEKQSCAIGYNASSTHENSVAIGAGAKSTGKNQIVLGDENTTVYIPGHLAVQDVLVYGGYDEKHPYNTTFNSTNEIKPKGFMFINDQADEVNEYAKNSYIRRVFTTRNTMGDNGLEALKCRQVYLPAWAQVIKINNKGFNEKGEYSDRRLKNVGEKFTAGLEQIKKLELYNFTFKKDEAKTPQVGVMAQDLQKVFPNAVWKGEDGYLRIRWDEMFYAVINAVKELDAKVTTAFEQIKANTDKVAKLQAQVDEQKQEISELKAQNAEFEKRLAKLEKKAK